MFSKLIAVYAILTFLGFWFLVFAIDNNSTEMIISSVVLIVFSLTNTLVFGKLSDMQTDVQIIKNKLGIKDEEKPKPKDDDDD